MLIKAWSSYISTRNRFRTNQINFIVVIHYPYLKLAYRGASIRKIRFIAPNGKSHELEIEKSFFGRNGNLLQCIGLDGKRTVLMGSDRAITRLQDKKCHFSIFEKNGELYIRDMGSSNGTFVDGKRLPGFVAKKGSRSFALPDRCTIKVGKKEMTIEVISREEELEAERKRRKADNCMDYGLFKKASDIYFELGELGLAKEARQMYEDKRGEKLSTVEKKILVRPGAHYTEITGHHHVVGSVDDSTKQLVIEREELEYLREASRVDLEVIKTILQGNGSTGLAGEGEGGPGLLAGGADGQIERLLNKIIKNNPGLSPETILEKIKEEE